MTRLLQGMLALSLLLSQAGWLDHLYHQHDLNHDEVCEQCLVGNTQDHALIGSDRSGHQRVVSFLTPVLSVSDFKVKWTGSYLSRAPPAFSDS